VIVLGLCGSLRPGSFNLRLLEAAGAALAPEHRLVVFDGLADVAPYVEGAATPAAVARLLEAIAAADAVLVATPEYNASVPGQLKNALDWASRPFPANALRAKPVAVVGASTGLFGAVWAQAELRKILATIGADVVDADLPVGRAHDAFGADGSLLDAGLAMRLEAVVADLVARARPTKTSAA